MDRAAQRNIPDVVVARVAAVLSTFDTSRRAQRVSDISRRSGLPMSTTSRLLAELVAYGLLTRTAAGLHIGPLLATVGRLAATDLPAAAVPHLTDLAAATTLTAHLAALDGPRVTYLITTPPLCSAHSYATPTRTPPGQAAAADNRRSPAGSGPVTPDASAGPAARNEVRGTPFETFSQVDRGVSMSAQSKGGGLAHACAAGKALLAAAGEDAVNEICEAPLVAAGPRTITDARRLRRELARIRAGGIAYECEESGRGRGGLAVVVPGTGFAVGVSGRVEAVDPRAVGPALQVVARALGRETPQSRT